MCRIADTYVHGSDYRHNIKPMAWLSMHHVEVWFCRCGEVSMPKPSLGRHGSGDGRVDVSESRKVVILLAPKLLPAVLSVQNHQGATIVGDDFVSSLINVSRNPERQTCPQFSESSS